MKNNIYGKIQKVPSNLILGNYGDVAYVNNHYYIYEQNEGAIWRQSIEESTAEIFMNIKGSLRARTLRTAFNQTVLIINSKRKKIHFLPLTETSKNLKHFVKQFDQGTFISDLRVFGPNQDHLAVLTTDRWLKAFRINIQNQTLEMYSEIHLRRDQTSNDYALTLAVSPCHQYFAVHTNDGSGFASRIALFKLENMAWKMVSCLDVRHLGVYKFHAMSFVPKVFGRRRVLTAVSKYFPITVVSFEFDEESGEFYELKGLRKKINARNYVYQLERVGDRLLTVDYDAKVISIEYKC